MSTKSHTLSIPGWHPVRLNVLLGAHWAKRARLKRADRLAVAVAAHNAGIPRATARRRLSVRLTLGPRQRGGDPDAYFKSLLDSLVACGLLVDDSRQWCELGTVTFARGPTPSTTVTLDDDPDSDPPGGTRRRLSRRCGR